LVGIVVAWVALMLRPSGVWLAVAPIDLRCGMDRLLLVVQTALQRDGFDGSAYIFRNKSGTRIKMVCADAQGVWLCVRRLHRGSFVWPSADAVACTLTAAQLEWLLAGVDWRLLSARIEDIPRVL
jgi:transposase